MIYEIFLVSHFTFPDEFFGELKRGKTGRREGGRSNRRGSARSTTMHSTVGLGKRGGYKQ